MGGSVEQLTRLSYVLSESSLLCLAYRLSCRQETKILPQRSKTSLKNFIFHIAVFYVIIMVTVVSYIRDITLTTVAMELTKFNLDLVDVPKVR